MDATKFDQKAEDIAQMRIEIISPLLENEIDKGKLKQMKALQCQKYGISTRSVERYLESYRKSGYKVSVKVCPEATTATKGGKALLLHAL